MNQTIYQENQIYHQHIRNTQRSQEQVNKSVNSSSRLNEQGSTLGSNSSKFSPSAFNPRSGFDKNAINTKSYNSLMTMLMNNEQALYNNSSGKTHKTKIRSSINTPNSNTIGIGSSRTKNIEMEHKKGH